MTEDFNIRDSSEDLNFPYHSIHSDTLTDVVDSLHLELSRPTNQVSTRYLDNQQNSNSFINLIFLRLESSEYDNHSIHLDQRLTSDYASLTINIVIFEKHVQTRKCTIVKNSKEEKNFVDKLIRAIKELNMENIQSKEVLDHIVQSFTNDTKRCINIQNLSISLNTLRHGGMKIVVETQRTIDSLNGLKIGNNLRAQLGKPNTIFLT